MGGLGCGGIGDGCVVHAFVDTSSAGVGTLGFLTGSSSQVQPSHGDGNGRLLFLRGCCDSRLRCPCAGLPFWLTSLAHDAKLTRR